MREKKAPGRFTLQFNLEDPQQKEVSDLLEQQGRRKAQISDQRRLMLYPSH